jgi:putative peptide maturation system protein
MVNDGTRAPGLSVDQRSQILEFVERVNLEQLGGRELLDQLRQLEATVPGAAFEVVSDTENIGGDITHCLLVAHNESVYSVSCARRHVLPWALRGATNAEAGDLLTVNGYTVKIEEAVPLIDFIWQSHVVAIRMVDEALLTHEIVKMGVEVSEDELNDALRQFYLDRNLTTVEAQSEWRRRRGLTERGLLRLLARVIARRRTERMLVADQCDDERRRHARDYDVARVLQAVIPRDCASDAEGLLQRDRAGLPAQLSHVVAELARTHSGRGVFRIQHAEACRYELDGRPDEVFGRPVGSVALLRAPDEEPRLIEILEYVQDVPDEALERRIVRRLVTRWCESARSAARIEWHWGRVQPKPGEVRSAGTMKTGSPREA